MRGNFLYLCCLLAGAAPFLAVAVILLHYFLRRMVWKVRRQRGDKRLGFCPSSAALGMALLFMQVFIRPTLQHVLQEKQEEQEDADEDDQGDPESRKKHFNRQLKRIRRGEPVDDLILRL
jgi:hypothetical protein